MECTEIIVTLLLYVCMNHHHFNISASNFGISLDDLKEIWTVKGIWVNATQMAFTVNQENGNKEPIIDK